MTAQLKFKFIVVPVDGNGQLKMGECRFFDTKEDAARKATQLAEQLHLCVLYSPTELFMAKTTIDVHTYNLTEKEKS